MQQCMQRGMRFPPVPLTQAQQRRLDPGFPGLCKVNTVRNHARNTSMHAHLNAPAEPLRSARTLSSDDIYDRVKEMAARFEFRPNERINEIELSRSLSVSRTPLREVLNRLMVEGFLTRE